MKKSLVVTQITAIGFASIITCGGVTITFAAPIPSSLAAMKAALPSDITDVRYKWGGHRGGWGGHRGRWYGGAGVAAGIIAGGIAASAANRYYYGPDYYDSGYYDSSYYDYPAPVYVAPPVVYARPQRVYATPPVYLNGPVRQCFITTNSDRGTGYWQPC